MEKYCPECLHVLTQKNNERNVGIRSRRKLHKRDTPTVEAEEDLL